MFIVADLVSLKQIKNTDNQYFDNRLVWFIHSRLLNEVPKWALLNFLSASDNFCCLLMILDYNRLEPILGFIWIQTVWHFDTIP